MGGEAVRKTHDADEEVGLTTIGGGAKRVAVLDEGFSTEETDERPKEATHFDTKVVGIATGGRVPHVRELGRSSDW